MALTAFRGVAGTVGSAANSGEAIRVIADKKKGASQRVWRNEGKVLGVLTFRFYPLRSKTSPT